jgi:glycyl-tRNA synthetase
MDTMEKVVALAKRRGFVYPTSEIYGGLSNSYDYGPVGAELLRNIRNIWWREFINKREDMVGLDTQIILHPQTWVASGHVGSFSDPMVEDLKTHKRYRADHLIEDYFKEEKIDLEELDKFGIAHSVAVFVTNEKIMSNRLTEKQITEIVSSMTTEDMDRFIKQFNVQSPVKNDLSDVKAFNLLFESSIGTVEGDKSKVYLRGETAQGIFTNFKQVTDSTRVKLPFGIGNIGRSFRNEITTGQFIFRTLEFEQAEIEYFFDPEKSDWEKLMHNWRDFMFEFVTKTLGVKEENLRWRRHTDKERSHYSKDTYDLDYKFPFGFKELWGIAYRTNYDLTQHQNLSGKSLEYIDPVDGHKFIPHVIEPAVGINRLFLMLLSDAYEEDGDRVVLKLDPKIAPYKAAIFPLLGNKPELTKKAREIYEDLKKKLVVTWDDRGNIGKRYFYQDEIGTPYCITVDFQTLDDNMVTIRDRDTAKQERLKIEDLEEFLEDKIK